MEITHGADRARARAKTDTRERVNARRCDGRNYEVLLANALVAPSEKI